MVEAVAWVGRLALEPRVAEVLLALMVAMGAPAARALSAAVVAMGEWQRLPLMD